MKDLTGRIVYFVERYMGKLSVKFGRVSGSCEDEYLIDFLAIKECRYVKGVPFEEFIGTKWRKIPKEYKDDYRKLYDGLIVSRLKPEEQEQIRNTLLTDREGVERLYEAGILVTKNKIPLSRIEIELNRNNEYRIVKKVPAWVITYGEDKRTFVALKERDVFESYEEATNRIEEIAEKDRAEAKLSDEEWSKREIEKVLRFFPEDVAGKYREILFSMPNLWDLEVKKSIDKLMYRYFSKRSEENWRELVV